MNLTGKKHKWGVLVLGILSAILAVNLVREYHGIQPGRSHAAEVPTRPTSRVVKPETRAVDDLLQYDPEVHFSDLKELDSRGLPDEDRNPFEFVGGAIAQAPPPQMAPTVNQAPAPPPLKAVGYNELPGGQKEAMVTFNDDLSVVHEGDTVGAKFKVLSITPQMVVVEDGDTHEKIELPFAQ